MSLVRVSCFSMLLLSMGCRRHSFSPTVPTCSGTYRYKSTPENGYYSPQWLRLNQNGQYIEFNTGSHGEERLVKTGRWRVLLGNEASIALDQQSFPIEQGNYGIRLVVSDDRGEYYQRVK